MRMKEQLLRMADLWSQADGRSIARLATIVVRDGKFFDRIGRVGKDLQTETFEKFLSFFRDGANWPDGRIPQAACDLLDNFANIATGSAASTDNDAANIDGSPDAPSRSGAQGGEAARPEQPAASPSAPVTGEAA